MSTTYPPSIFDSNLCNWLSGNYPAGVTDSDPEFDLPDAGEDEIEPELCVRCGVPLTSADYEGERCSQCGKEIE